MIYKDKWYTIAKSFDYPVSGEIGIALGDSTILFFCSSNFSSAFISLMNFSIVPGLSLDIRLQKIANKHQVDIKYQNTRPDSGFEPIISFISSNKWREATIQETNEQNTICSLRDIKDIGGSMNPWVYMYIDSSIGYIIAPGESTDIDLRVLKGWYDITDKMIGWQWSRASGGYADDLAWNIAHSNLTNKATISYDDLGNSAALNLSCAFTIQAVYENAAITSLFTI